VGDDEYTATTYEIRAPTDVAFLPTRFSTEYFGSLFRQNFATSDVKVYEVRKTTSDYLAAWATGSLLPPQVTNIIYKMTKGLDNFSADKTTPGQKWIRLF